MTRVMDAAGWNYDFNDDAPSMLDLEDQIRIVEKMLRFRKQDDPKVLARDIVDLMLGS